MIIVFHDYLDQIPFPTIRPDLVLINKKKRTCHLVDFVVPVEHRVKIKERPDLVLINKKKRTCYLVDFVVPMEHRAKIKERPDLVLINKKRTCYLVDFVVPVEHRVKIKESPDLVLINKKKRTCYLVDFVVPVDHRWKIKEKEKINKYLDVAGEQPLPAPPKKQTDKQAKNKKKLWNIRLTIILIIDCALGNISKGPEKRWEELEIETIQTTAFLRSVTILIRVSVFAVCHSDPDER